MPHPWALPLALIFTTYGSALGIYTFINPVAAARLHGVDIEHPARTTSSSFGNPAIPIVTVFGGRGLATGVALFALYWQGMSEAMGILMLSLTVAGVVDTVVVARQGPKNKAWTHVVGTAVMGLTGWGLVM